MASDNLIFLGIGLGVFASMSGTIGKQLFRMSELARQNGNPYVSKVTMTAGLVLNVAVGPIVDMLSYMFAPQSLIAPLGGLDVVWNTMIAPCTLGEKLTPLIVFGAGCIAVGATLTSCFGNHSDKDYTLDLVKETFIRPTVAIYLIVLVLWICFNILYLQPRSANPKGEPWASGDPIRGLSLGVTAGSIAGNMFCVKGFVELVQASFRDKDADIWAHWLPYTLLVGAVIFAVTNLTFLTKAMREYEALFMGAVFEGSLIFCASVSGMVVYKDLENLSWLNVAIYFMALSGIVLGIFVVALACHKPIDKDEDEDAQRQGTTSEIKNVVEYPASRDLSSSAAAPTDAGTGSMTGSVATEGAFASTADGEAANDERATTNEAVASGAASHPSRGRAGSASSNFSRISLETALSKKRNRTMSADSLQVPFPGHAVQSIDMMTSSFFTSPRNSNPGTPHSTQTASVVDETTKHEAKV